MTTAETVRTMVAEQLGIPEFEVKIDSRFRDDLEMDSLDAVQLAIDVEDKFGLPNISDSQMDRLSTVQDMVDFVERSLAARAAQAARVMSLREVIDGLAKAAETERMTLTADNRLVLASAEMKDQPEGTVVVVLSETLLQNILRALRAVAV